MLEQRVPGQTQVSHYLYRLYNDKDELLYIGISKSAIHRLHQHLETQPWAEQIAKQTIERFASRQKLESAERKAILKEKPKHNITYNDANAYTARRRKITKAKKFIELHKESLYFDRLEIRLGDWAAFGFSDGSCFVARVERFEDDFDAVTVKPLEDTLRKIRLSELWVLHFDRELRVKRAYRNFSPRDFSDFSYLLYFKDRWEKEYVLAKENEVAA